MTAAKLEKAVSQRFPDAGDQAAIYELLAREIHPLIARIKDIINAHADDIDAFDGDLTALTISVAALSAALTVLTSVVALKAEKVLALVTETGTTRNLVASDAGSYVRCTNGSGCTVTVNTGVFTSGQVTHYRGTAGVLTLVEGGGVTINKSETLLSRKAQSPLMLVCLNDAGTEYDLFGDMDPV